MILGVHYYRPPFPERKYWAEDLAKIRDTGLEAVQFWTVWGWMEKEPGTFLFDDYDELMAGAEKRGLKVILSTVAEIQPFWILREIPEARMIDHGGNKIVSQPRVECNVGLTPGGCTDHPEIQLRMGIFLTAVAQRYGRSKNLFGWDCWNELRWAVHADGYLCYCPQTIQAFRRWLNEQYGGLEGLNAAWRRRYCHWDDVFPAKQPGRSFPDLIDFCRFLTWRSGEHARFRYEAIRIADPDHVIIAHNSGTSLDSAGMAGGNLEQPLARGSDWDIADKLDGYGISQFPEQTPSGDLGFQAGVECLMSAAGDKPAWISELLAGRANFGHMIFNPVDPQRQQRWIWNAVGRGVKGIIFWCWRDEIFGSESSGFGLAGSDGLAEPRLAAMKKTAEVLKRHQPLWTHYRPERPKVGVWFDPSNYYFDWAADGNADHAMESIKGYLYALERLNVPYRLLESSRLEGVSDLKMIFMPWSPVVTETAARQLDRFVRGGGVIFCEAETNAFTPLGFYRYSGPDRTLMEGFGLSDEGRRPIENDEIIVRMGEKTLRLQAGGVKTPLVSKKGIILGWDHHETPMIVRNQVGPGAVYQAGTYLGFPYFRRHNPAFETFISELLRREKVTPDLTLICDHREGLSWRIGSADDQRLLFVTNSGTENKIQVASPDPCFARSSGVTEIISGAKISIDRQELSSGFSFAIPAEFIAVFTWPLHPENHGSIGRKKIPLHGTLEKSPIRQPASLEL